MTSPPLSQTQTHQHLHQSMALGNNGWDSDLSNFEIGRTDCSDPDSFEEFPDAHHAPFQFFEDNFGFNADETTILFGAHTLGRAQLGNSGTKFDSTHGSFIPDACSTKPTFRLEELVGSVLVKREVGSSGGKFGEFVGTKLIKYTIINME